MFGVDSSVERRFQYNFVEELSTVNKPWLPQPRLDTRAFHARLKEAHKEEKPNKRIGKYPGRDCKDDNPAEEDMGWMKTIVRRPILSTPGLFNVWLSP